MGGHRLNLQCMSTGGAYAWPNSAVSVSLGLAEICVQLRWEISRSAVETCAQSLQTKNSRALITASIPLSIHVDTTRNNTTLSVAQHGGLLQRTECCCRRRAAEWGKKERGKGEREKEEKGENQAEIAGLFTAGIFPPSDTESNLNNK